MFDLSFVWQKQYKVHGPKPGHTDQDIAEALERLEESQEILDMMRLFVQSKNKAKKDKNPKKKPSKKKKSWYSVNECLTMNLLHEWMNVFVFIALVTLFHL